jgi:hypothetical protein
MVDSNWDNPAEVKLSAGESVYLHKKINGAKADSNFEEEERCGRLL